ncbi:MAG: hypothetical protein J7647_07970 [Cyanobacteria bacterium SBLK]|nr:hypothetical protein [Cyanobacteria bacterium SBLK]
MERDSMSRDRLDRIERILDNVAQRQEIIVQTQQQQNERIDSAIFETGRILGNFGERLERVEAVVEQLTDSVNRLTQNVDRVTQSTDRLIENAERDRETIRGMQSEIRGIQVENQRIIRHFFGEENE